MVLPYFLVPALLPPVIVVILVGALLTAGLLGTDRTGLHRGALAARWAGCLAVGVALAAIATFGVNAGPASGPLAYGAIAVLAPAAAGIVLILAITLGELTLPATPGDVRRASLHRRTLGDLMPRAAVALTLAALTALLALTLLTTLSSAPDRRSYSMPLLYANGAVGESARGPYPGLHYTLPLWISLLMLLGAAAIALRVILQRRPSSDAEDILLRRRSSTSVLGAIVLVAGMCLPSLGGPALLGAGTTPPGAVSLTPQIDTTVQIVSGAAIVLGLAALPVGLVMVVFPEVLARRQVTVRGARLEVLV